MATQDEYVDPAKGAVYATTWNDRPVAMALLPVRQLALVVIDGVPFTGGWQWQDNTPNPNGFSVSASDVNLTWHVNRDNSGGEATVVDGRVTEFPAEAGMAISASQPDAEHVTGMTVARLL